MSTVATARPVDAGQLATEVGAPLRIADLGDRLEVTADIPQAALRAAIDAHVPAEPTPTADEQIAALKERLTAAEATTDQIILDALMGDFPPL